ncbi:hemicentin-2-like [Spodoptera litura]|uniref:Hemolin n=1 Tax=Spodoptera litura TaxID=69820 RepID=A0A9J7E804_SPOLT|nr:hemicentin-2-like [Spodoptera litura]
MISKRAHSGLLVLFFTFCAVADDAVIKSSLTFVIDDTASMWNEIKQVKEEVNIIFEKVLSSKASQIENFVLVTFNDPYASQRTVTTKRDEFKSALASIHVHGGGDCPEAAMEGISLALRISRPHSYLYVFTDASAKDYARFEQVKSLSQKMQSQIVFILTGECNGRRGADYQVFHQLAEATSGQVFHMMKDDVKDILKYIEESITGIGSKLVDTKLPSGYGKNLTYIVDPHTGDVLIAVTGKIPKIDDVIGPDGSRPDMSHIVSGKSEMAVVKVTGAKPGEHVVSIGSMSETHAVVSAKSTINFQLGFNVFKPKSSKDIVTRPPPKGNVFMGVKLLGTGVKLETVQILGMKDEVIEELTLELLDEKSQFYVTPSFNPPSTMFRVIINGYDVNTKLPVTRRSPTPISRQDLSTDSEVKVDTAPKVTIDGDTSITLYVDDPLELTCKVHAYPEPEIIWEDRDIGIVMPAEIKIVEVPYDYVSILKIDKANRNTTYQCKANNRNGNDVQGVEITAKRKFFFDVIDSPKDIRIEYAKEGKLICKVDAYPSATINWYKDAKPLSSSSRIEISKDQTVVTLKDMQPGMEGKFMCEARNDKERKVFYSHVEIFGIEQPVIDKSVDEIRITEKKNGELSCRILKGIPKPTITWSLRGPGIKKNLKQTGETIKLKNTQRVQSGLYICTAKNVLGTDNHETEVIVEYPPLIKSDAKEMKVVDDDEARLTCDVVGVPTPTVYWTFNSIKIRSTSRTRITTDYSLIIKTTLADTGHYGCHAENKLGKDERKVFLQVYVPVTIEKPKSNIVDTMVGSGTLLNCRADG